MTRSRAGRSRSRRASKKVLELALREALSLGHNYIGTEHVLLGLMRENEGVAARILLDFDADAEKIRNEIIRCSFRRWPELAVPTEPIPGARSPTHPAGRDLGVPGRVRGRPRSRDASPRATRRAGRPTDGSCGGLVG